MVTTEETIKVFEDMKKGVYPYYPNEYIDAAIKALKDVSTKPVLEEATVRNRVTGATEEVMIDKARMQLYLSRCTVELCNAAGWDLET